MAAVAHQMMDTIAKARRTLLLARKLGVRRFAHRGWIRKIWQRQFYPHYSCGAYLVKESKR